MSRQYSTRGVPGARPHNEAQLLHEQSGLAYHVCAELLGAFRRNDTRRLAIIAEKHLLTADQNESLKEYGLTVFDLLSELEDYPFAKGEWRLLVDTIFQEWNNRLGTELFLATQPA